ncbi:MAG: hypothetical protein DME32_04030 [Verrucomicrobia bacterium]|nr:MAG: hypothetical protein DME32_04030 [Verrucomicrobiota bacterium]
MTGECLINYENPIYYLNSVLEIGNDGWIKVVMRQRNQTAWINTNAVPIIAPYPFEGVQNPR